jgi:hypothetical protein
LRGDRPLRVTVAQFKPFAMRVSEFTLVSVLADDRLKA